jgi:hypothetical protein
MKRLCFLLLCAATQAGAADWIKMTEFDNQTLYLDKSSFHKGGDSVRFWEKVVLKKAEIIRGKEVKSLKAQYSISCSKKTQQVTSAVFYSAKGEVIGSFGKQKKTPIVPGTLRELPYDALCRSRIAG